jgi:hypothetical protein
MKNWIYEGKEFDDSMIPEGAVGFVYQMVCVIDGVKKKYIGKKNFGSDVKTSLGVKASPTDKRKKNYKRVFRLNYKNYFSSNEVLKEQKKLGNEIHRDIVKICFSKTELTYQETKYLFTFGVLESDEYLNGNILGKFYKQK